IETADSMKSRGYGLRGRTAFSVYRFDDRDKCALAWLGGCGFFILCGGLAGGFYWRFYPTIAGAPLTALTVTLRAAYLALCLTPLFLDLREDRLWRRNAL
ncbi:MAG: energy-coupling factor transporter transmembrane protein EcfT, partial [Oscillospiraceae bacterium]|nr:energy-coupling factor transporter transmembrane protein EcfT [Oscillospiraceae bacterium]